MQRSTSALSSRWTELRVVRVLATKDIVEALRNKTTLTVLLGLSLMLVTVQALPLLLKLDHRPRVALFDGARTEVPDTVRQAGELQVLEMRTAADAIAAARATSGDLLAVVLPAGWDERDDPLLLDGYYVHWLGAAGAAALASQTRAALSAATGRPVTIRTHALYPTPESRGHEVMVALGLVLAIILVTAILVPYLFLDEKRAHTLEVLYVSPASPAQVVAGKGVAGMVYGVLAAAVLLAFNLPMVVSWSLMVATVLGGALLGTGLGLLIGLVVENEGTVQMWVGALTVAFMFPLLLVFGGGDRPAWLGALLPWLPASAMFSLFRSAFANVRAPAAIARDMAVLLGSAFAVLALVVWRLRRWEAG